VTAGTSRTGSPGGSDRALVINDLADLVRTHAGPAGTANRLHFLVP
jgi:hypothetical protein